MAAVARTFPETQNCTKRKGQILSTMTETLTNQFDLLGLINTTVCSNSTSCIFYDWSKVYAEMLFVFTKIDWMVVHGQRGNLTVAQALVLLHIPSDSWLGYTAYSIWVSTTLIDWFRMFAINDEALINPAIGLNNCLQLLTSYDLNQLVNKLKRSFANLYMSESLAALDRLGFDLNSDMLQSCLFNGNVPCVANYTLSNDCKFFSKNCTSVTYRANNRFKPFWHNQYGMCYTFNDGKNTGPIIKTGQSGHSYGLRLSLVCGTYLISRLGIIEKLCILEKQKLIKSLQTDCANTACFQQTRF